ncbi:uncharacterized protein C8Q71DRAFT_703103 [Rhodofomes roseus]|uniref:Uncharacterized protein n=1 Tax=Rhodofomes roseus TaxID=34475 RepID=A0ABQ8KPF6_9APHY|nr:uncharacterized protein C8Q71DRAFT_703103 [Rhodofomes roseus]KAH9840300.1 hypothetical protein C8Q71DRAFT_703103 [Rhodofomes roseus]
MRIGRVRAIFSIPEAVRQHLIPSAPNLQCPRHLAYVEWFSKFPRGPETHYQMYKVTATLTEREKIASVVPLALLERSVHLHPKWGGPVPVDWTSENVMDECATFYLNQYKNPHDFYNLY